MQPVGQYKVKTKMFLAVLSDKPQCCGEGNIFETKNIPLSKKIVHSQHDIVSSKMGDY